MNTSGKPVESKFLRRIPTYGEEPQKGTIQFNDPNYREVGEKIGGKGKRDKAHNELIQKLIRENEELRNKLNDHTPYRRIVEQLNTERKRSARWKKYASILKEIIRSKKFRYTLKVWK